MRSYSDPFGQEINYTFDKAGKPTDVIGSSFGGVTDYSRNAEYRAWGSLKAVSAGSGMQLGLSYNNRLRTSSYSLEDASQTPIMDKSYSYQKDGKLSYLQDHLNARFDRLNTYDHAGRIRSGKSGAEARGGTVASEDMKFDLPYRQSYAFNEFNNLTGSTNLHWGETSWVGQSFATNYTYLNNRVQQGGWTYDEDGRNTASSNGTNSVTSTFNAAGKRARTLSTYSDVKSYYDGNGAEIKRESSNWDDEETEWIVQPTKYFIRSSVFGGNIISEVWASGKKHRSYVKRYRESDGGSIGLCK
ncbi:MAG: hypothetical protein KF762_17335 [Acidobacteria bacterium]|nr:hypothetical protein [Acidobacteriota bacterium]